MLRAFVHTRPMGRCEILHVHATPDINPKATLLRWTNIELHPDSHCAQLHIKVLQHSRYCNDGRFVSTDPFAPLSVFPNLAFRVRIQWLRTSPAPNYSRASSSFSPSGTHCRRCAKEAPTSPAHPLTAIITAIHQPVLKQERTSVG